MSLGAKLHAMRIREGNGSFLGLDLRELNERGEAGGVQGKIYSQIDVLWPKWEKPRIKVEHSRYGRWRCECRNHVGLGDSPMDAYSAWWTGISQAIASASVVRMKTFQCDQ